MKLKELKSVLKPLIKQCVKEVLLEETGILSKVVSEVVVGMSNNMILSETKNKDNSMKIRENIKSLMPSINFNNTSEEILTNKKVGSKANEYSDVSAFKNISPNDPGVNIDWFMKTVKK